ncbi:MAG: hypothetical protein JXC32_09885 [Anaerolineae bacterium]|nr:hypothetical protein [Anaerolineae bacterium]
MTPLAKKLRLHPKQRMLILNAPEGYINDLGELPEGSEIVGDPKPSTCDYVHLFVENAEQYAELGSVATAAIKYDGILWVSYPKKSSRVETDLSRDAMWGLLDDIGWHPVSQVSINSVWSAVRFRPSALVGT